LFEREHHRRVVRVLEALDARRLHAQQCLFGGGTALALRYGGYRESVDIHFLVSHREGYRALRQWMSGPEGIVAICTPEAVAAKMLTPPFMQTREVRADQYGVRTMLRVDDVDIKFEIVLEGRINLDAPGNDDLICGVATLTPLDALTSKLLANSDRWRDDAVLSRDLIDMAMMMPGKTLLREATAKAEAAYGAAVVDDLRKAIQNLRQHPHRLDQCMQAMRMTSMPKALLWKRIKALEPLA
jgi:Nucleotidyl transferase AbiEii toxin, Type IV TA system